MEENKQHKNLHILGWFFSILFIVGGIVFLSESPIRAIGMICIGIMLLPIRPIYSLIWQKIRYRRLFQIVAVCIALALSPTSTAIETNNAAGKQISTQEDVTQDISENKGTVQDKKDSVKLTDTETDDKESAKNKDSDNKTDKKDSAKTEDSTSSSKVEENTLSEFVLADVPDYSGTPYIEINNNNPFFNDTDKVTDAFENYSELDSLGRCGVAFANICPEIEPTEERGAIGSVKPSGWHTIKYDCVDGKYLYNRCHLIGYQLAGENANEKNLITGTRYMNVDGMLPFEDIVDDYVDATQNHVLYRVTPFYNDNELVARGVLMEAYSVEDNGSGVCFNVFCYNIQPGVAIDYATGESSESSDAYALIDQAAANTAPEIIVDAPSEEPAQEAVVDTPPEEPAPEAVVDAPSEEPAQEAVVEEPAQPEAPEVMVWLTETGSKYHSINNCGRTNPANAYQVTESQAISSGYGKCSKCW